MSSLFEIRPLYNNRSFSGTSGDDTIDLPKTGKVSAMIIEPSWANAAGGDNTLNILELLTKIEVVHRGSEIIKSLDGLQAAGIAWRRQKHYPFRWYMGNASSTQRGSIMLLFGRYLGDPMFGLDMARLSNPQLRLTWNYAYGTSGDTSGAFSGTAGTYDVLMVYAPDRMSYQGYIKSSELYNWTIAASATERVELPIQNRIARIYLENNCADRSADYNIASVVLNLDSGAHKPIDLEMEQLMLLDTMLFGSPRVDRYFASLNDTTLDILSLFDKPWKSQVETQGGTATCHNLAQGIYDPTIDLVASAATIESKVIEEGHGFGRLYTIAFDMVSIEDALNSRDYGRIELEVEAASAVGTSPTGRVLLDELVA